MERRISRLMPQQQSGHFHKGLSWPQLCLLDDTRHLLVQHHHEELWHGSSAVCKRQLGQKTGKQRGNLGISTSTGHWWPSSFGSLAACIDLDWKLEPPQTHQEYSKQQYQKHNRRHWMPSFCLQLVEEAFVFGWSALLHGSPNSARFRQGPNSVWTWRIILSPATTELKKQTMRNICYRLR